MIEPQELTPLPGPLPGLTRLRRRLADRLALRDDLIFRLAATPDPALPGKTLGDSLDIAGDPTVLTVAELWARVADGVCAYAEMTAGEIYLGTAQDWTDVRRIVDLVGYRPAQRTAAHGWIRVDTAPGASPLVPAGTQVQAPGTPRHPVVPFEVAVDTQLRADWAGLTVTAVPVPTAPVGDQLRLLADPGFRPSDQVVFVSESVAGQTVRGVARVTQRSDDLGTTLLGFDRSLAQLLPQVSGVTYIACRLRAELIVPSRLDKLSYVSGTAGATADPDYCPYSTEPTTPYGTNWVFVTDGSAVSPGQQLILYGGTRNDCLVTTVTAVTPQDWHVAPGIVRRVAKVSFADALPTELSGLALTVLLIDPPNVVQHYELPDLQPGVSAARLYPAPAVQHLPPLLAVEAVSDGSSQWELTGCSANLQDLPNDPGGVLVNLTDARSGVISRGAASGNLAPIRQGTTSQGSITLTGGTAVLAGPITGDVAADGTVTDSLIVSVGGVRWEEVSSLYGRTASELVYTTRLAADGRMVLVFGDGVTGALPRGEVTASWRVGSGLAGEVPASQITSLAGAVNGIRKIAGVGTMSGAADQEDPLRMRRASAAGMRAAGRAVALGDLADLALTIPGTSHSVAWLGLGPPGCACGGSGIHVAVLRLSASGVRVPDDAELLAVSGYLDARRDISVGVCVCAAVPSAIEAAASVAVDPRRDPAAVLAAVQAALLDPAGPLAPVPRDLGVPLDGSAIIELAQPVAGVIGITGLALTLGPDLPRAGDMTLGTLGRLPAQRYELLYLSAVNLGVSADG
jgi:hypothetical protein